MLKNIAGYASIDCYVNDKIKRSRTGGTFHHLFSLMFSEKENVFWEENNGYNILTTTYGESAERITRRAATLRRLLEEAGAAPNSAVGLYLENSLEWIELFWSILLSGHRPLLLNLRMPDEAIERIIGTVQPVLVISSGKAFSCRMLRAGDIALADQPLQDDSCGTEILMTTSGTSENVKICAYSAATIFAQLANAAEIIRESKQIKKHYEGNIKQLTLLPFYHVFGLFAVYFWFGFFSRTFVHLPDLSPQTLLNTIRKHRVTHVFAVPMFWNTVYASAMNTIERRGKMEKFQKGMRLGDKVADVPGLGKGFRRIAFREVRENLFGESVQFCITGGSAVKPEVLRFFNGIGYHLANGYGMTEVGITSVELSDKPSVRNSGSVGHPMTSVKYELLEDGGLHISGSSVADRIWEGGACRSTEGGIATSDLMICREGRYYCLGRQDDVIITPSGENLNPDVTEQVFQLPFAEHFCLIPAGEKEQTQAVLLVSIKRFAAGKIGEYAAQIKQQIDENQLAGQIGKVVFVTDELMLPNEIKVNRKRLARKYSEGAFHIVDQNNAQQAFSDDDLELRLKQMMADLLGKDAEQIRPEDDFFLDAGGTSMDYYMLAGRIRDEFGVDISAAPENHPTSVQAMAAFLKERLML